MYPLLESVQGNISLNTFSKEGFNWIYISYANNIQIISPILNPMYK